MALPRLRSVRDLEVQGKRVLLRVDFNVPLDKNGRISPRSSTCSNGVPRSSSAPTSDGPTGASWRGSA
jgi:hypothetical protein